MTETFLELMNFSDLTIPCERPTMEINGGIYCDPVNPADWIVYTNCPMGCEGVRFYCTECKDRMLSSKILVICVTCKAKYGDISPYKRIEPLR